MAAADPCRLPSPAEAALAERRLRSQGLGLTDAMLAAVEMISGAIRSIADAIYNSTMINNAAAHAMLAPSKEIEITAGTAKEIWINKLQEPVVIYCRAQAGAAGIGANILLSLEIDKATHAKAIIGRFALAPEATVILPPNATLYADIDPAASGTVSNLVFSVLPLKGALGLFKAA